MKGARPDSFFLASFLRYFFCFCAWNNGLGERPKEGDKSKVEGDAAEIVAMFGVKSHFVIGF